MGSLLGNRKFSVGFAIFIIVLIGGVVASRALPFEYRRTGAFRPGLPPGIEHILGTDSLGRDVAVQLASAVINSLQIGLIAAIIGTFLGSAIGFTSGYYGGALDSLLRILIDVFLSVPSLLFLILIASLVKGVSVQVMAMIIALFSWSWPARQIRAQVLSLKERGFVYVAMLSGMSKFEIIVRELMPNMLQWMGANFINAALSAILTESGLSLLGLGPQGEMTLGMMIYWSLSYSAIFRGMWWWWSTPVVTLVCVFLSLYLMHLGSDEVSNPRMRSKA
ncbi:MAG: ABC transporter permease [bacterium]